jgi:HEAT repeat protein
MLNPKSLLKVLPVVLLSFGPIVGMGGVVRSEVVVQQPVNQSQTIKQLIQQLKSGEVETRSSAARALEKSDPKDSDTAEVRSSAARALGEMGESAKSAIPSLLPLLNDSDRRVRSSAASALGHMGESAKSLIPSLIPLLNDSDWRVRLSAKDALAELGYKP